MHKPQQTCYDTLMMTLPIQRLIASLLFIGLLAGCNRTGVYGIVTNPEGETLPGVSVRLSNNSDVSAITNVLGEYRLNAKPGHHSIQYAKSGYTLVNTELVLEKTSSRLLPKIEMWNLPPGNNVFFYTKSLYTPTTWLKPKRYYMSDNGPSFGTTRNPEFSTDESMPFIVCYRMPRYDARLTRLQQRKAQLPQDESQTFDVWVPSGTISVNLEPLVPSDTSLLKVNLYEALEPGRYALHWGALDGYTTIDERMFMFEILKKADIALGEANPNLDELDNSGIPIEGDAP